MEYIKKEDLKTGFTYAAGELYEYVFRVKQDGRYELAHRTGFDKNSYIDGRGCDLHVSRSYQRKMRFATQEEIEYLNRCIENNNYFPPPCSKEQKTIEQNYQIF